MSVSQLLIGTQRWHSISCDMHGFETHFLDTETQLKKDAGEARC